jgi:hypothetical protein
LRAKEFTKAITLPKRPGLKPWGCKPAFMTPQSRFRPEEKYFCKPLPVGVYYICCVAGG